MDAEFARRDAEMLHREQEAAEKACLRMELAQLKKNIAVAEKRHTAVQLLSPPPAAAQPDMHADSLIPASTNALQSASGDAHTLVTSADSQHLAEMRSALLTPTRMTSADGHTQPPPPPPPPTTVDNVNSDTDVANVTAAARDVHAFQHSARSAPDGLMSDHDMEMRSGSNAVRLPPPPLQPDSGRTVPAPGAIDYPPRQLIDSGLMSAPTHSMTDYATMSADMTATAGPPRELPRTPALLSYSFMNAVDVDHALSMANSSQFSMTNVDRCDLPVPLYTAPSVVPAVTFTVPTAVHTFSLFSSGAYASQTPAGAQPFHVTRTVAVAKQPAR